MWWKRGRELTGTNPLGTSGILGICQGIGLESIRETGRGIIQETDLETIQEMDLETGQGTQETLGIIEILGTDPRTDLAWIDGFLLTHGLTTLALSLVKTSIATIALNLPSIPHHSKNIHLSLILLILFK